MSDPLTLIDPLETPALLITWDMGRRCNYDCTYCPSYRHDNFSPHAPLNELKSTARFVLDYATEMVRFKQSRGIKLSFTGGEPTVHPQFIEFGKWLKNTKQEYLDKPMGISRLKLALTSNGTFNKNTCDSLIENYNSVVISYHCEAPQRLKNKVKDNMVYLKEKGFPPRINVMFHAKPEYFDECIELCDFLKTIDIPFIPRMIGEFKNDGLDIHKYTKKQLDWMRGYWFGRKEEGNKNQKETIKETGVSDKPGSVADKNQKEAAGDGIDEKKTPKKELQFARDMGRPCCGGRKMNVCDAQTKQWSQTKFLKFTEFKNWKCSVNWFFLHIEQQTGLIYHHQTCQAKFNGTRGSIGTIKDSDQILNDLKIKLKDKKMPVISCPNKSCGCGLCTPKAANMEDFKKILPRHVDLSVFENTFCQSK